MPTFKMPPLNYNFIMNLFAAFYSVNGFEEKTILLGLAK
jgi:hypothetical protein